MKKTFRQILAGFCVILLAVAMATTAFAHKGRTDSSGGHRDNNNVSGLGNYHYHCGGNPAHLHTSGYCPYTDVFPTGVKVAAEKTTLGIGETVTLTATVYPDNACSKRVSWSSSDPSVVTVYNGVITAKNYGTATITAETFNEKTAKITVTVKEITAEKVAVLGLPEGGDFYIRDSIALRAEITPANVDNPTIVWSSSDEKVATVSGDGYVQLVGAGTVEIRATASNGVAGTVVIQVQEKFVESVEIAENEIDMLLGGVRELTAVVTPADATYPELSWVVANPQIASVSPDGRLTALACGETVITATSANGLSDSLTVRVSEIKAESLRIEGPASVYIGDTLSLAANFTPADTTIQEIQWSVSDSSVAEISQDGVITVKGVGTVVITAVQKDVSAEYTLEILPIKVEEIRITSDAGEQLAKGDTVNFTAEVFPENATYPDIVWSVSDSKKASIDSDGVLTVLKGGKVTVTATAEDGFSSEYELKASSPMNTTIVAACVVIVLVLLMKALRKKKK